MRICYNCGARLPQRNPVPFKELCPKCDAFLHCCRNCRFYAPEAHNHCLSHTTEPVGDVERGNYCDEFQFIEIESSKKKKSRKQRASRSGSAADSSTSSNMSAREKFENLFKD